MGAGILREGKHFVGRAVSRDDIGIIVDSSLFEHIRGSLHDRPVRI
jgi:hypothetical protein